MSSSVGERGGGGVKKVRNLFQSRQVQDNKQILRGARSHNGEWEYGKRQNASKL